MLSLQEISDRLEIQQLLIDYSTAIDRVFTPDAEIDYRAMGGIDGRYPQVKAWLAEVLPSFPSYAHMLGNFDLHIDGDSSSSRTICFKPNGARRREEAGAALRELARARLSPYP